MNEWNLLIYLYLEWMAGHVSRQFTGGYPRLWSYGTTKIFFLGAKQNLFIVLKSGHVWLADRT